MTVAINEFSEASKHQQRVNDRPSTRHPGPPAYSIRFRWTVDVSNADMRRAERLRHLSTARRRHTRATGPRAPREISHTASRTGCDRDGRQVLNNSEGSTSARESTSTGAPAAVTSVRARKCSPRTRQPSRKSNHTSATPTCSVRTRLARTAEPLTSHMRGR